MSGKPTPYESFVDAWLETEPEARLLRTFAPESAEPAREARLVLSHAIEHALLGVRDVRASGTQLGWWVEELARAARGAAQHPVARRLAESGAIASIDVSKLGAGLARVLELESVETLDALISAVSGAAVDGGGAAALARALRRYDALAADPRGLLPLELLARHGATRADAATHAGVRADFARSLRDALALEPRPPDRIERIRHAHARLLAESASRGDARVPPLRGLFVSWRAAVIR